VGDAKILPGQSIEILAFDGLARRESDRMDEDVETIPVRAQCLEDAVDLSVVGDIQRQNDVGAALGRGRFDA